MLAGVVAVARLDAEYAEDMMGLNAEFALGPVEGRPVGRIGLQGALWRRIVPGRRLLKIPAM